MLLVALSFCSMHEISNLHAITDDIAKDVQERKRSGARDGKLGEDLRMRLEKGLAG